MTETIVACLTPPGSAAIATVGLFGDEAWQLVAPLFQPFGRSLFDPEKADGYCLGRFGEGFTDRVVVTVRRQAGGQWVELGCHGGDAVVRWLIDLLCQRGARVVDWEEWLRRTSSATWQAEAAIKLAHAPTLRTANILLDQFHGALAEEFIAIKRLIARNDKQAATARLQSLLQWRPLGRHLTQPWHVVVAGAPNVGKSSLINALLGYQRAITSPIPGTTRDLVTAVTAFDGWPMELVDTAGIRAEAEGLEAQGIERAEKALASADLCLWVVDRTQEPVRPPSKLAARRMIVCNKSDLAAAWAPWDSTEESHSVSALTGEGLRELMEAIVRVLIPAVPSPGAPVPFTDDVCKELLAMFAALNAD